MDLIKEKQIRRKLVNYIWQAKLSKVYQLAQDIEKETGLKIID
jgi:hypothetical protein